MNEEIKEEWNIGYKVFRKTIPDMKCGTTSGNLGVTAILYFSLPLSLFNHGGLSIKYQYDEIIYPKIGKIFGFKSIYDVKSFIKVYNISGHLEIWKISAKFSQLPSSYMASTHYDYEQLKNWWKRFEENGKIPKDSCITPKGTVLCDAVKLIEKV